jgi:hypothetical protein
MKGMDHMTQLKQCMSPISDFEVEAVHTLLGHAVAQLVEALHY